MWISNTATTAMMLPIANAVLQQLKDTENQADTREFKAAGEDNNDAGEDNNAFELETQKTKQEITDEKQPDTQLEDRVCK